MSPCYSEAFIYVVLTCGALAFIIRHLLSPRPLPGIPHRPITSILGDIPGIAKHIIRNEPVVLLFFEKYAKELGPIYQVLIGPSVLVVISDVYLIEDLLRTKFRSLDAAERTIGIWSGMTPNGQIALRMNQLWKKHRRLGGPGMSPQYLKSMCPRIANVAQMLVAYWKEKMAVVRQRGGNCFDPLLDFQMCTMDSITEIVFGEEHSGIQECQPLLHSTRSIVDSYGGVTFPDLKGTSVHQAFNHIIRIVGSMYNVPSFLLKPAWFFTRLSPQLRKDENFIRGIIISRLQQARKRAYNVVSTGGSEDADCLLDIIIEKELKEGGETYKDHELVGEIFDYVMAGYDTTASALAFGVKYLTENPSVQIKLREELLHNLSEPDNRHISYDDIATGDKTPYLEAVMSEILRCGQIGGVMRDTMEDITIQGKVVPKGTEILFLTGFAGMRATKSWGAAKAAESSSFKPSRGFWNDEDTEKFVPERWLTDGPNGEKVFSANQGYSAPFGYGPRACFGQKLAMLEIKVMIATISLSFFLDRVPKELDGTDVRQVLVREPEQCYVSLREWEDVNIDAISA
ncbi:hypothetical protein FRC03_012680 [Tulasnella sp. 419]|nr:hypothetical protein FRC03_012680 [Tulasnella sp. 419]